MGTVTLRVRSVVWFVTGVVLSAVVALMFASAWRVDAAPGDDDATFVATAPCRLADTRAVPNRVGPAGTLSAADTQTFAVHGSNGECTIPAEAVAVSLNVTALGASELSFLTFWPDGDRPLAASLNPAPGQPPVPNAVTVDLSDAGSFNVYNASGTVDVVIDANGYYTMSSLSGLDARVAALESKVATLEGVNTAQQAEIDALTDKTASMTVETVDAQPTLRFSGVNVQVVDGSGDTDGDVNGLGNLIVGYNENNSDVRTGSHNLVVGDEHTYTSYGGVVFGFANEVSAQSASVTGGYFNAASGAWSSVTGGHFNAASGAWSSVTGGFANTASGAQSSVAGGDSNTASGENSSVTGGESNEASGLNSSVSGGQRNVASNTEASVSGGVENEASGNNASVSGGWNCTASASHTWGVGNNTAAAGCPTAN